MRILIDAALLPSALNPYWLVLGSGVSVDTGQHMLSSKNVAWIAAGSLGLIVLLLPAFVNGFPFVFADTGGYLARPFERTLALGRSALYGLFLAAGIPFDFWPNIVAQAGLTLWVMQIALRVYGYRGPLTFACFVVALAVFTTLPWYVGQLMPDIFVPLAVIALHLLAFARERLRKRETLLLMAVVAFAMASHMSIVALVAGLLVLFSMLRLLGRRLDPARPALRAPIAAAAAGIALALASNLAIAGQFALTPGGSTFLFARLLQDGIVARYLNEHCPDPTIRLCAYRAELPVSADNWLWGNSPLGTLGGWEELEPEGRRIIFKTIASYPFMHIRTAARATAEQLVTLATGEGLGSKDNWHARRVLQQYAPDTMTAFAASRQEHDAFEFGLVNFIHVPVALVTTAMLPVFILLCRRRNPQLSLFAATILLAIVTNAAICGIFSNPNARYQARITPLAALTALMVMLDFRKVRSRTRLLDRNSSYVEGLR
jgi:hypothetical protein